jgi:hypothetical protein
MVPEYEITNYGSAENGFRELCAKCLNAEVAASDHCSSMMFLERFVGVR